MCGTNIGIRIKKKNQEFRKFLLPSAFFSSFFLHFSIFYGTSSVIKSRIQMFYSFCFVKYKVDVYRFLKRNSICLTIEKSYFTDQNLLQCSSVKKTHFGQLYVLIIAVSIFQLKMLLVMDIRCTTPSNYPNLIRFSKSIFYRPEQNRCSSSEL